MSYPRVYLYKRLVQAKLFIDEQYATPINLGSVAGEAFFSKFHFIRLFKKAYGRTPGQYLTAVRVDRARTLLRGGHNVTDACYAVGFDSLSSFTGLFKRLTGQTPSAFKRECQAMRAEPLHFVPPCFAAHHGWASSPAVAAASVAVPPAAAPAEAPKEQF
ncbi:MAG TPA: AraC family transcriptional regulator [Dinghuibacter sp.]|uniref:AraC family transcriptional regulator n=1 Tax=Dinghuibacter sp. TaxID=2024697 RepID=UPI002C09716E|nr:AraC family transcriptional regulator [Dinghuibacter sp.]HTJ11399.1 AraC family transcriptional regulator [Dinghuibacter sp.]